MSNYANTKATIAANVYENHLNQVTANMAKAAINSVVDALIAGGFLYKGVATTSTNPGSPDANVFYIASTPGTYTNFGSLVVADGEVAILKYNGSWSKEVTGAATAAEVTALGQKVDEEIMEVRGSTTIENYAPTGTEKTVSFVSGKHYIVRITLSASMTRARFALSTNGAWSGTTLKFAEDVALSAGTYDYHFDYLSTYGSHLVAFDYNGTPTRWGAISNIKVLEEYDSNLKTIADNVQLLGEHQEEQDGEISRLSRAQDDRKLGEIATEVTQDSIVANYYMGSTYGNVGPYSNWNYYKYSVNPDEKYSIKSEAGQDARLWLLLNGNTGVSLSSDSSAVSVKEDTITIPTNVDTLVVNCRTGDTTLPIVKRITPGIDADSVFVTAIQTIKEYVDANIQQVTPSNILFGKVLVCVGDSITEGADMDSEGITDTSSITAYKCNAAGDFSQVTSHFLKTYGYQIAERNNMVFYNGGVSGSTMQGLVDKNGFSLADGRYTKLPDNIDYLTIWFGWNDAAYGTLGTIDDVTNESYYGGFNVVMPYLINKYPFAKIALIVPFGTSTQHRNAVRQLANKWGVACWDNYQGGTPLYYDKETSVGVDASIVTSNRAKFQANGAHPNFKGHRQLGDMLEHFLRGI